MKEFAKFFAVSGALFLAGCASSPNVSSAARAALANNCNWGQTTIKK